MEQKNLKTCVFSVDTVLNDSAEIPIDIDFALPDYYADISKILKCCAIPRISSKNLNGNTITVEGCVTVTVIYCGSNNCVSSYEYQYPFSKSFDALQNTDGVHMFQNYIRTDSSIEWAQDASLPVSVYKPSARSAKEYKELTKEVVSLVSR